jgi:hypothetical protein
MIIGQRDILNMKALRGRKIGYEGTVVGELLLKRALSQNQKKRIFYTNHNCLIQCLLCRYHLFYNKL